MRWLEIDHVFLNAQASTLSFKNVLVVLLAVCAIFIALKLHACLKTRIDPRSSFVNFILFFSINLLALFCLVFLVGFLIIYFKEFFFKT